MGGQQVPGRHLPEDGFDEEGFDESQRAEILEATRDGPSDGNIMTDLAPDLGGDALDDGDDDNLTMTDDELGEEDSDALLDEVDMEEDSLQDDFEDDAEDMDDELGDGDRTALEP